MRRYNTFLAILVLVFIGLNLFIYLSIRPRCIDYYKEYATSLVEKCGGKMEQVSMHFESEANFILFSNDLSAIFEDLVTRIRGSRKLESFYSEYADLIKDITVYDNRLNVYSLFRDNKNIFISDYYVSQNQKALVARDQLIKENEKEIYYLPVFKGKDEVVGNIAMNLNQKEFFNKILDYYRNLACAVLFMLDDQGDLYLQPPDMKLDSLALPLELLSELEAEEIGARFGEIPIKDFSDKVVVAYYPVRFVKDDYYILYFLDLSRTLKPYYNRLILISALSFIIVAFLAVLIFRRKS